MRKDWSIISRRWLWAVAGLFLVTGGAKLNAAWGGPDSIPGREPVFGVPLAQWSMGLGYLELGFVVFLLAIPQAGVALRVIRLMFAAILAYRILLAFEGGGPCACLGRLLATTPLQEREGTLLWGIAVLGFLGNEWVLRRWGGTFNVEDTPKSRDTGLPGGGSADA